MTVVAGVDSSTQSTKVELRDLDTGRLVGSGRAPHPTVSPPCCEQDPSAWWSALRVAFAAALAEAHGAAFVAADVTAVAVAGQQHGLVVLDDHGAVVRPAKLWNDTESAADADWLVDRLPDGKAGWARAVGSVPVASFTITKLSWLHRTEPAAFARLAHVLLPHDWLTHRLTGAFTTDRGDASGTGYWSPAAGDYRYDLLAVVDDDTDWAAAVPTVLGPLEPAGELTAEAAAELGLVAGITVAPGTGDNMAGALGLGLTRGEVAVSVGTSGTVYAVSDVPTSDPTGAVAGFADASGRFLPLVCTLNAAGVTDAMARLLEVDPDGFDALALAAPPGAGGLVLVPYLAGERTPDRPHATGSLLGIRPDVSRSTLARAAVEGVVCGLLEGLAALRAQGVRVDEGRVVLIGGGARSAAYRRVLADLSGRAVTVPAEQELVAAGAALQAAATLAGVDPARLAASWGTGAGPTVEPDPTVDRAAVLEAFVAARG